MYVDSSLCLGAQAERAAPAPHRRPPGLSDEEAARVIGLQAAVRTEHMDSARVIDYMAAPRLCAVAEVAWSGPGHSFDARGDVRDP